MMSRERHLWNKTQVETQFYLTSLPCNAQLVSSAIRQHWSIEKRCDPAEVSSAWERALRHQLHWVLDVTFNEDKSRIRAWA